MLWKGFFQCNVFFLYTTPSRKGGGGGNWKILHITLTKQAVWPAANGFKLFQASRLGKLRAWGSWLGLGVKMKAAEELRTCSAGKTFYTFNEAAATSRHTPQSLRLAIFLFLRFRKGHLENLSWLMKTELIIVTKITNITNYICGEKIVMWRNFGRFCHNLRAFMWRKIEPKKYSCVEKMTNMRSGWKFSKQRRWH